VDVTDGVEDIGGCRGAGHKSNISPYGYVSTLSDAETLHVGLRARSSAMCVTGQRQMGSLLA
jgi:hypothetical protein